LGLGLGCRVQAKTPFVFQDKGRIISPYPTALFQHPTPNTRHPTPNTRHPTPNTQHPAPNTQHPTPSTQHPTPDTRHPTLRPYSCGGTDHVHRHVVTQQFRSWNVVHQLFVVNRGDHQRVGRDCAPHVEFRIMGFKVQGSWFRV
jgi:hypothetical protein